MRSVDLVSREWCDLVFEGRNRSYGAYRLRQEAGRRYVRALMGTLIMLVLLVGTTIGVNAYVSLRADRDLARLLEEMRRMEALQRRDAHLLRFVDTRPRLVEAPKKVAVSVPEIVESPVTESLPLVEEEAPVTAETDTLALATESVDTLLVAVEEAPLSPLPLTPTEVVQEMPEFPGGIPALMQWLDKNVVYPPLVINQKVTGTTYLTFLVDQEGDVTEPEVQEPLHPMITSAILKAARKMPRWEPGKKDGQVSIVRVTIPIEYHP